MKTKSTKEFSINIKWTWKDIKEMRDDWTREQCLEALNTIGRTFRERSIEESWQILEDLIFMNKWAWDK